MALAAFPLHTMCLDTPPSCPVVLHHDEHTEGIAVQDFANDRMVPGKKWRRLALTSPSIDAPTGESAQWRAEGTANVTGS